MNTRLNTFDKTASNNSRGKSVASTAARYRDAVGPGFATQVGCDRTWKLINES